MSFFYLLACEPCDIPTVEMGVPVVTGQSVILRENYLSQVFDTQGFVAHILGGHRL